MWRSLLAFATPVRTLSTFRPSTSAISSNLMSSQVFWSTSTTARFCKSAAEAQIIGSWDRSFSWALVFSTRQGSKRASRTGPKPPTSAGGCAAQVLSKSKRFGQYEHRKPLQVSPHPKSVDAKQRLAPSTLTGWRTTRQGWPRLHGSWHLAVLETSVLGQAKTTLTSPQPRPIVDVLEEQGRKVGSTRQRQAHEAELPCKFIGLW